MKTSELWRKLAKLSLKKEKEESEKAYSNLENAEPELCIKLIQCPSVHNFLGLQKKIESSDEIWIKEFIDLEGIKHLLEALKRLSKATQEKKEIDFKANTELLQCVICLRTIMNDQLGFEFAISYHESAEMLAESLCNKNETVKLEVIRILAAMCRFSDKGRAKAIQTMEQYKKINSLRFRFSWILKELKTSMNMFYATTLLCFVNALIRSTRLLRERMLLRNEFLGVELMEILSKYQYTSFGAMLFQIDVFKKCKTEDESLMSTASTCYSGVDVNDHTDVFSALFKKVCNTPQGNCLLSILQSLLLLNTEDPVSEYAWEIVDKMAQRVTTIDTVEESKKLLIKYKKTSEVEHLPSSILNPGSKTVKNYALKKESSNVESDGFVLSSNEETTDSDSSQNVFEKTPSSDSVDVFNITVVDDGAIEVESDSLTPSEPESHPTEPKVMSPSASAPPPPPPPPPPVGGAGLGPPSFDKTSRIGTNVPKPSQKLKKVNWAKLTAAKLTNKPNSLWDEIESKKVNIDPDYSSLDQLFHQKITAPSHDSKKEKEEKQESLIQNEKLNLSVGIFLHQTRKSASKIIEALQKGNITLLGTNNLKTMEKYLPSEEEKEALKEYEGDISKLSDVEQYLIKLIEVEDYELRIQIGIMKSTYEEKLEDLLSAAKNYETICKTLLQSEKLKQFFLLILKTGNYLNYGSYAGNAFGFQINSILKLKDTKSDELEYTLLQSIVEMAEEKKMKIASLNKDFKGIEICVDLPLLSKNILEFQKSIAEKSRQVNEASTDIQRQSKKFFQDAIKKTEEFNVILKNINDLAENIAKFFVQDSSDFDLDKCLGIIAEFLTQVEDAITKNKKRDKNKGKQKIHAKKNDSNQEKRSRKKLGKEKIIESLMNELQRGM